MEEKVKVFIKINEKNEIIDVNSSIFLRDTKGWILLDEGIGDKFVHAQGNYFGKPIIDEFGKNAFVYENEQVREV